MATTSLWCKSLRYGLALAATTLGIAGIATAADKSPQAAKPASAPATKVVPLNSGVSAQEFPSDVRMVTMERRADGTRIYHLNGQGMQSLVAHIGKDGKIEYTCTDRPEQTLLHAPAENAHEQ